MKNQLMAAAFRAAFPNRYLNHQQQSKTTGINAVARSSLLTLFSVAALSSSLTVSGLVSAAESHVNPQRPNVIMILLDDTGFADIGAFGSEIKTPNIDALAKQGIRYNRFDTNAICAPTRASLITGRNAQTVHMEELPPKGSMSPGKSEPLGAGPANSGEMPTNAQTVAQALHASGYATYALGKWHLAPEYKDDEQRNKAFWPLQKGFDYYYGFISGHADQWHPALIENNKEIRTPELPGYHLTTDLVDHAVALMNKDTDANKPKFLYLALGAAHAPYQVPKSYIQAYHGEYNQGWDALRQERFARQKAMGIIPNNTDLPPREKGDAAWDSLDQQHQRVFARYMETYAAFITHTDEQIGRLVTYLKETNQYDNTLIMFATDNGAASEGGPNGGFRTAYMDKTTVAEMDKHLDEAGGPSTYMLYPRPWAYAGVTPFRRYKLWPYAGGIRTPLIISWPKVITEHGAIRQQYVQLVDLAPTMLDAAGTHFATSIDGVKQIPVAGQSILPTLTDANAKTRDTQYFELRGQRAITHGKWKAVAMHRLNTSFDDDQWELFDTQADYAEAHNVAKQYPEKLKELQALWWKEANRLSDPAVIKPGEMLYKFNRMDDGLND